MSEDQKKVLEQQLWNIANTLRGNVGVPANCKIYWVILNGITLKK
jgi:hypothetical protein